MGDAQGPSLGESPSAEKSLSQNWACKRFRRSRCGTDFPSAGHENPMTPAVFISACRDVLRERPRDVPVDRGRAGQAGGRSYGPWFRFYRSSFPLGSVIVRNGSRIGGETAKIPGVWEHDRCWHGFFSQYSVTEEDARMGARLVTHSPSAKLSARTDVTPAL